MERAIGEIFQEGKVKLKVVENSSNSCRNDRKLCYYNKFFHCHKIKCMPNERSDNTQVNFIKQENK